ncbi:hypothetical protein ACFFX0_12490 [Citricoccus parietis]|uniref:Uncharacterized protein n=1 Tax=Citricoccus parietis TaxID=592307 RepID=A0ABV5FZ76_9MICC
MVFQVHDRVAAPDGAGELQPDAVPVPPGVHDLIVRQGGIPDREVQGGEHALSTRSQG